ncbi:MAG: diadenylate cyclase CdaA, partial [Polyangiales bacterium]
MPEGLHYLFTPRPIGQVAIDLLDIALVAFLVYRVLKILRGTRAMQMGIGLLVVAAIYIAGRWLGLVTLVTVLSTLLSSILLVVVVIFQNDLRRGLLRAGARPLFLGLSSADEAKVIEEIIAAVTELARLRHGAIICWERDANLDEFIVGAGTTLDAQITRELLVSIFIPVGENKLHDGAVIIRNLRIAQAGVFFPMPEKHGIDKQFGSRHRAALGITSDTDAIAIVVSEERGTIMFCFQDNHVDNVSPEALRSLLRRYEQPGKRARPKSTGPESIPPRSSMPPVAATPQPQPAPLITVRSQALTPLATPRPITLR